MRHSHGEDDDRDPGIYEGEPDSPADLDSVVWALEQIEMKLDAVVSELNCINQQLRARDTGRGPLLWLAFLALLAVFWHAR